MKMLISTVAILTLAAHPASAHDGPHHDGHDHEVVAPTAPVADHGVAPQDGAPRTAGQQGPQRMRAIALPPMWVSITIEGDERVIRANGIPNHATGTFPTRGNPNAIRPQAHEYRIPAKPTIAEARTEARPEFGIAVNGVIFDSGTGEFWSPDGGRVFGGGSPWNFEAIVGSVNLGIDRNNAHVQPTGKYHYHGLPVGLLEALGAETAEAGMVLIGWAGDGFPMYGPYGHDDPKDASSPIRKLTSSWRLKSGERPSAPEGPGGTYDGTFGLDFEFVAGSGDLDESNGRFGVTPEFPGGTYYYVVTEEFPNVPRSWRGEPGSSFQRRGGAGGPNADRGEPGGPRGAGRGARPGGAPRGDDAGRPGRRERPGGPPRGRGGDPAEAEAAD